MQMSEQCKYRSQVKNSLYFEKYCRSNEIFDFEDIFKFHKLIEPTIDSIFKHQYTNVCYMINEI